MSKSKKNRAKIRARKAPKRTARRKGQWTQPFAGGLPRIDQVAAWPLLECLISDSWREIDLLTHVLIARKEGWGRVAAAAFLVDQGCLGAKDGFCRLYPSGDVYESALRSELMRFHLMVPCSLELAAAVITESIAYAKGLGFDPHPDVLEALPLLGDLDSLGPVEEEIPLGLPNGKPFYIAGPDDDVDNIVATLRETVGDGNFDYIIPASLI